MLLVVILFLIFFIWFLAKPYCEKRDTICLYTGGNGSGKSLFSIIAVILSYKKQCIKVAFHNFLIWLHIKNGEYWDKPMVFSNIGLKFSPFIWSKVVYSHQLKYEHLLLLEALPPRCVVFVDEVNLFLDQMKVKFPNAKNISLFVTLCRHFLLGPYVILNTQNVNKVHYLFRYCANESLNLFGFRRIFKLIAWTNCRHVSIGDDIKTIEVGHKEDNSSRLFCLPFKWFKCYDTYTYSNMYMSVPQGQYKPYYKLKTMVLLKCPVEKAFKERTISFIDGDAS